MNTTNDQPTSTGEPDASEPVVLLPCPFCASPAEEDITNDGRCLIYCPNESCEVRPESGYYETRVAFQVWNDRSGVTERDKELMGDENRMRSLHWLLNSASLLANHPSVPDDVADDIDNAFRAVQPHL